MNLFLIQVFEERNENNYISSTFAVLEAAFSRKRHCIAFGWDIFDQKSQSGILKKNGAILVKTGRYDGLMQVGMLDDNREGWLK